MRLFAKLVFNYAREIVDTCLMIAESMIKRAECVVTQRRRIGNDLEHAFAMLDHFGNLKTVPASLFFTQDRVGADVKIEDSFHFTSLRATRAKPDHKNHSGDKHHDYGRKPNRIEHRHNYNNRDRLCREFPRARTHKSSPLVQ